MCLYNSWITIANRVPTAYLMSNVQCVACCLITPSFSTILYVPFSLLLQILFYSFLLLYLYLCCIPLDQCSPFGLLFVGCLLFVVVDPLYWSLPFHSTSPHSPLLSYVISTSCSSISSIYHLANIFLFTLLITFL